MVMSAVYELCDGTDCCLISRADILSLMPKKAEFSSESLDDILFSLHVDGYFDLITSERKGERMYVITYAYSYNLPPCPKLGQGGRLFIQKSIAFKEKI